MQSNNFLRPFSTKTTNIYSDSDINTLSVIGTGAPSNVGAVADSKLYNSLSATTTLACTALIDFVASQNPSVSFGQTLAIDNWISAVNNSFVSLSTYTTAITNLTNGTTVVGNATNAVNLISGGTIASDVTATTQASTDNSTKVATTAFVTTAIQNALNFEEGNITKGGDVAGKVYRLGKLVFGYVTPFGSSFAGSGYTMPNTFSPTSTYFNAVVVYYGGQAWLQISTSGALSFGNATGVNFDVPNLAQSEPVNGTIYFWYEQQA